MKDKQIFEMAMLMSEGARPSVEDAEALYNAGYRKASDVAREIFEEIESKKMFIKDHVGNMGIVVMLKDIAELKKKYEEDEG